MKLIHQGITKILCFNLLIGLTLSLLPIDFTKQSMTALAEYSSQPSETALPSLAELAKMKEKADLRSQNTKVFDSGNGKLIAQVSSGSLNYKDDLGKFQPIDNTFQKDTDGRYKNKANRYEAKFKEKATQDFLSLKLNYDAILVSVENANIADAAVKDNEIVYKNIHKNVDLRYLTLDDSVNGEVILTDKPEISEFSYRIKVPVDASLQLSKDGDVSIVREQKTIFFMGRPSIIGRLTGDPIYGKYSLTKAPNGDYLVKFGLEKFIPSGEMASYPVSIDPTFTIPTEDESSLILSGQPNAAFPMNASNTVLQVGNTFSGEARSLLKFSLPNLSGAAIDGAMFGINCYEEKPSVPRIKLYRVTSPWSASSVTWNSQPSLASNFESSYAQNNAYAWWNFDITQLVKDWYSGTPNHGIALKAHDPSIGRRNFYSKYVQTTHFKPYVLIYYNTNPAPKALGIKNWWQYAKTDLATSSSAVNIATGNHVVSFLDVENDGRGLDMSISHTYNSDDRIYNDRFGYGWTISANKRLIPSLDRRSVTYIDETGTSFFFNDTDGNGNYVDSDGDLDPSSDFYVRPNHRPNGLNWGLKFDPSTDRYSAKTSGQISILFDADGKILEERDRNNNTLTYSYDADRKLVAIVDASGRSVKLYYNLVSGRLERIEDHNFNDPSFGSVGAKILYTYANGDLIKITYYTGTSISKTVNFSYSNHLLTAATDYRGYTSAFRFSYDSSNRVIKITDPLGKITSLKYLNNSQTQVISPKGNETGANASDFTTDYFFRANPYFQYGLVYREIGPPTKDDKGVVSRKTIEYDYNDDYKLTAMTDPTGAVEANGYDTISGMLLYQWSKLKYLSLKNSYNYSTYDNPSWRLVDSFDANGTQTTFYYDARGNLIRKGVIDGEGINLLHNGGFESATRGSNVYDPICNFKHETFSSIADYWCTGGTSDNKYYGIETGSVSDGIRAQAIGYNGNSKIGSVNVYQTTNEITPTLPATDYVLSFRYRNEGDTRAPVQMAVEHYDTADNLMGSTIIYGNLSWNSAWTSSQLTFRTPGESWYYTTNIYLRIKSSATGVYSKTYFDGVKLERGTNPSLQTEKYTTFNYNSYGQPTSETTPEGKTFSYSWDEHGNMTSVTDPMGNTTSYTYDANGNKMSKTEPKGNLTTQDSTDFLTKFTYNGQNLLTSSIEAKTGKRSNYYYNYNGNLSYFTDPKGSKTSYVYDLANRLVETISPYGHRSKVEYDANGNAKGVTDPNRAVSANNFDSSDRLERETDPLGYMTKYDYDSNDNLKTISLDGKTISHTYDSEGKITSENSNFSGTVKSISYDYDKNGNIVSSTNQSGDNITNTYTATEEISRVAHAGQTTSYTRNKNNQVTQIVQANGDQSNYSYNANGATTNIRYSRNGGEFFALDNEYDANGNRSKILVNDSGIIRPISYEYDNNNQLIKTTYPEGTKEYSYDPGSGRLTKMVTFGKATSYTYNQNRVVYKLENGKYEFFGYDANGNLTSRDNGDRTNFLLHLDNNLINSRDEKALDSIGTVNYPSGKFGQGAETTENSYIYGNSAGNIYASNSTYEFWFKPNWSSDSQNRTFFNYYLDANNYLRLQKISDGNIRFAYRRSGIDYGVTTTAPVSWNSDTWYHLAFGFAPSYTNIWLNGTKIAERKLCPVSTTNSSCVGYAPSLFLNAVNFYIGASFDTSASEFANGTFDEFRSSNISRSATEIQTSAKATAPYSLQYTTIYNYDSKDRLTKIKKTDGVLISYTYDTKDRLIKRSQTGSGDINYSYDDNRITQETANDGTILTKYLYDADGALLMIVKNGQNYTPIYDTIGSIVKLRDSAGNTVSSYNYDEWGKILSKSEAFANPIRYAGYWYDEEVGLYHLGARWYAPDLMRFVSVDPHPGDQDDSLTLNEYVYCKNSPINFTDPDGDYIETAIDVASFAWSANEFRKNRTWGNFGWAAFDALMIALPIAPGSGIARAGLKAAKGGKTSLRASERAIEHILSRHTLKRQLVEPKKYTTYFNKSWSDKKVIRAVEYAANNGGKSLRRTVKYAGEKVTALVRNNQIHTGWGYKKYIIKRR